MASASLSSLALIFSLTLWVSLISPACSLNCTSQEFTTAANNKQYANCTDLPVLNSDLHYTYNASNSSLSIAFVATPANSEGWIAWAINPTATGMVGAQALIAFRSNGSLVVKTYNISSYSDIKETNKLSFDVWDLRAESVGNDGSMAIFAGVKVPGNAEKVNQVWQVGAKVTDGKPEKHEFVAPNLSSKGELQLVAKASQSPAPAPAARSTPAGGKASNDTGGVSSSRISSNNVRFFLGLLVFTGSFVIF